MADQASLGYVAQGREGTGEAQIYNSQPLTQQFTNYATNYLQQKQEKDKLAAQQKREDDKESVKKFENDFKYSETTFKPFQDALTRQVQDIQNEMSKRISAGEKYEVGGPFWRDIQNKQAATKAFALKGKDVEENVKSTMANIDKLEKTGLYDTEAMRAEIQKKIEQSYQNIEDFDVKGISTTLDDSRFLRRDNIAKQMASKLADETSKIEEIKKSKNGYETWQETQAITKKPFVVLREADGKPELDAAGNPIFEIDQNNLPQFMSWVDSDPLMKKAVDREAVAEKQKLEQQKGQPLTKEEEVALRQDIAVATMQPYLKGKYERTTSNYKDNTMAQKELALDWWKAKNDKEDKDRNFALKAGSGADENADALIGKWGDIVTGQAKEWNDAPTIKDANGKEFKQIDAQNLGGGGLRPDGTALGSIYKDAEGKTYYTLRKKNDVTKQFEEDIENKFPMKENDIDLFNSTVLNNKDIPDKMKDAVQKRLKERGVVGTFGGADWKKALTEKYNPTDLSNLNLSDYDKMVKYHKEKVANPLALTAEQKAEYISLRNKYKWMGDAELEDKKTVEAIKAAKQEPAKQEQKTSSKTEAPKTQQTTGLKVKPKRQE